MIKSSLSWYVSVVCERQARAGEVVVFKHINYCNGKVYSVVVLNTQSATSLLKDFAFYTILT
ncbi:hypothetical protein [Glaesserella parasuis]|uniref:Uncharacterized protein n=1 Tax=Glaesserella parasuis serovar 5 (strain SH0165) TaxID=557723 RepID=B8F6U6_GLAP5|nr:hypothetical protein HAPS_1489 [Glaesserella parasuis SH0165]EQA95376.1 hypothetical protein HPS_1130 [Glaesserella parasuis 29755]MDP0057574.1 hypothetical protein [Glaesserella parasuis]MDP0124418.1 hypothetical protein [Glaesserella parasuis]MDP0126531.1 hypothetical protein [Glaesserella parasuis]